MRPAVPRRRNLVVRPPFRSRQGARDAAIHDAGIARSVPIEKLLRLPRPTGLKRLRDPCHNLPILRSTTFAIGATRRQLVLTLLRPHAKALGSGMVKGVFAGVMVLLFIRVFAFTMAYVELLGGFGLGVVFFS